jgi:GDP-L-fucose synthase
LELKDKFGDERRTEIAGKAEEIEMEDLIAEEDMAITISNTGYVKRIPVQAYRKQYSHQWISTMPTNMYGPGDNFDLENSHVLPAMIRKFHDAKVQEKASVQLWGTGTPRREFLHSDDLGRACLFLLENYNDEVAINVGVGEDIAIKELAESIKQVVGFQGEIEWDSSKPDGTPRKLLDVTLMTSLGWTAKTELREGIRLAIDDYRLRLKIGGDA